MSDALLCARVLNSRKRRERLVRNPAKQVFEDPSLANMIYRIVFKDTVISELVNTVDVCPAYEDYAAEMDSRAGLIKYSISYIINYAHMSNSVFWWARENKNRNIYPQLLKKSPGDKWYRWRLGSILPQDFRFLDTYQCGSWLKVKPEQCNDPRRESRTLWDGSKVHYETMW